MANRGDLSSEPQKEGPFTSAMSLDLNLVPEAAQPSEPVIMLPNENETQLRASLNTEATGMPVIGAAYPDTTRAKSEVSLVPNGLNGSYVELATSSRVLRRRTRGSGNTRKEAVVPSAQVDTQTINLMRWVTSPMTPTSNQLKHLGQLANPSATPSSKYRINKPNSGAALLALFLQPNLLEAVS